MAAIELAIKIGTSFTTIYMPGNGVVLHEPTIVAFSDSKRARELLSAGIKAKRMLGKAPEKTAVFSPVNQGVVTDAESLSILMRYFLAKVVGQKFFQPRIKALLCLPCGLTPNDKKAYEDALVNAGVGEIITIERVIAAAVGAHLPVSSANGGVAVNIGGGTTEIGVLSLSGIVSGCSVNIGGQAMDEAVAEYIARKHLLHVGALTAERIKEEVGSLYETDTAAARVSGMNVNTRNPESAVVTAADIREAVFPLYNRIANQINSIINVCPAELGSNIYRAGIVLSGGASKISGLDKVFKARLNLPVRIDDDPEYSVINGAGRLLGDRELLDSILKQA